MFEADCRQDNFSAYKTGGSGALSSVRDGFSYFLKRRDIPGKDAVVFGKPDASSGLFGIYRKLVLYENKDLTIFHGASLDLGEAAGEHWFFPVAVRIKTKPSVLFHVIISNIDIVNRPIKTPLKAEFIVSLATEIELKLNFMNHRETDLYDAFKKGFTTPRILIRMVTAGNFFYPLMQIPSGLLSGRYIRSAIGKIAVFFGIDARGKIPRDLKPVFVQNKPEISRQEIVWEKLKNFKITEPFLVDTGKGKVYVYNAYAKNDFWKIYQIICWEPLRSLQEKEIVTIRVDSGCDNGMLYHDNGCDCHKQFLNALDEIKINSGFVLHAPTQDGRGYGTVLKLETELLKQGRRSALFPANDEKMSMVNAAKAIYGEGEWEARTFYGAGALLKELGFKKVRMLTENRQKISGISAGSGHTVEIERIPTRTLEKIGTVDTELYKRILEKFSEARCIYDY